MSDQTFKVRNGITLWPVNLSSITNPQSGDIVCDAQDGNKIKRYSAATGTWDAIIESTTNPNFLYNSGFELAQRGYTSTSTNLDFPVDRWRITFANDLLTTSRFTDRTVTPTATFGLRSTFSGSGTGGSYSALLQRIEIAGSPGFLGEGTYTLSFLARVQSGTHTLVTRMGREYGTGGSPSAPEEFDRKDHSLTTTWQYFTHTFTTSTFSGKTLGSDGNSYHAVLFIFSEGVNPQTGVVEIMSPKLEAGSVATPYVPRGGDRESDTMSCFRYYETFNGTSGGANFGGGVEMLAIAVGNGNPIPISKSMFRVRKRVAPTVTMYGTDGIGTSPNTVFLDGVSRTATAEGITAFGFRRITNTSGVTWDVGGTLGYNWVANSEV